MTISRREQGAKGKQSKIPEQLGGAGLRALNVLSCRGQTGTSTFSVRKGRIETLERTNLTQSPVIKQATSERDTERHTLWAVGNSGAQNSSALF